MAGPCLSEHFLCLRSLVSTAGSVSLSLTRLGYDSLSQVLEPGRIQYDRRRCKSLVVVFALPTPESIELNSKIGMV